MIRHAIVHDYPLVLALLLVAWLTAGSMAVRSVSRIWLRHWVERRLRGSAAAVTYLERPHRLLIASGVGTALTLVCAGVLLGVRHREDQLIFDVAVYGGLVVLLGQIVPRAVARQWPAQIVPAMLPVLRVIEILTTPILSAGRYLADPLIRRRSSGAPPAERDPIQDLLREGELEGVGEHDEIAIISGVVEFGEKLVRDVMMPRNDVFALAETTDPHTLAAQIAQSEYSRVPIFRGSIDQIIGMVHAFDVLKARGEELPAIRPVASAAPDTHCNELLFRMLRERLHLAVVHGPGGETLGIVTLEDLLEELVGDIRDEHDEPDPQRARAAGDGA